MVINSLSIKYTYVMKTLQRVSKLNNEKNGNRWNIDLIIQ